MLGTGCRPYLSSKNGSLHHSEVLLVQHLVHVWEAPPARGEIGIWKEEMNSSGQVTNDGRVRAGHSH